MSKPFDKIAWQRNNRAQFKATHGYSKNLFYRFDGNREAALLRDNYSCVKCSMTDAQHRSKWDRPITVDHKDKNQNNNALENLQTLCLTCHGRKDLLPRLREQKVPLHKNAIISMRTSGASYQVIADKLGFSTASIWKWIQKWNKQSAN